MPREAGGQTQLALGTFQSSKGWKDFPLAHRNWDNSENPR